MIEIIQKVGLNPEATLDIFLRWAVGIIGFLATVLLAIIAYHIKAIAKKMRDSITVLGDGMKRIDGLTIKITVIAEEFRDTKKKTDEHHDQIIRLQEQFRNQNNKPTM